jgi:hypothetical protein
MEATAEDRWQLVERVIELTDTDLTDSPKLEHVPVAEAAELIREAGIVARQHTGLPAELFGSKTTAEWLLGSYLDIVNQDAVFAVDPWLQVASERLARAKGPWA